MPTPNNRPVLEAVSRLAPAPRHYPLPARIRRQGEDTEERRRPYQNDAWLPDGGSSITAASGANIVAAVLANAGFAESVNKFYADGPGKVRYEGRILTGIVATVIASVEEEVTSGVYALNPELSRQLERLLARVEVQVFRGQSSTPTLEGVTLLDLGYGVLLDPHLHQFACDKEFRVRLVHPDVKPRLTPNAATRTWVEILLTATFEDFDPEAPQALLDEMDDEEEPTPYASEPPPPTDTPDPYDSNPPTFDGDLKPWTPPVQLKPGLGAGLAARPDLTRTGLLNVPGKASATTPASQLQVAPGKEGVFTLNKQDNQAIFNRKAYETSKK